MTDEERARALVGIVYDKEREEWNVRIGNRMHHYKTEMQAIEEREWFVDFLSTALADARRAALLEASEIAYKFCDTHAAHPKGCEIGDAILQRASEG